MRLGHIALAVCLIGAAAPSAIAQPERADVYRSLERMADAGARIANTFCGSEETVFGGALAAINAMPERNGAPAIVPDEPGIEGFADAYDQILTSGVDVGALERAAITGMINVHDPSGSWMSPEEMQRPRGGAILIELSSTSETPLVVRAFEGGPAQQAGILPGDRLIEVDGERTHGVALHQVVSHLQGAVGSTITVVVERDGAPLTFTMERARNTREGVQWRLQSGIGIITIEGFPENSARAVRDAIRDIRREERNPRGYIVDLRNNSGGLLDQVIETADNFIDGGVVTHVRPYSDCSTEEGQTYHARRSDEADGARLVVLVNENTASGAEMVAAALRERRFALIVGQTTFGNARVHTVIPMNGGRDGFLKLTTGIMTSPGGATWDETGLTPDRTTEPRGVDTDPPLDAAIALMSGTP